MSAAKQLCYSICAFTEHVISQANKAAVPQVHQVNMLANIITEWNCGFAVEWKDYIAELLQS